MKKLLLALLMATISATSFGMFQQQMMRPYEQDKSVAGMMLLAGLGCVGASMWYAAQVNGWQIATNITQNGGHARGPNGTVYNQFINIPPRTIGAIAPLIPALFCFYYGFKNLNS